MCRRCFADLCEKYANTPVPIGELPCGTLSLFSPSHITFSISRHSFAGYSRQRALLYKYLADAISLPARIHTHASQLRHSDAPTSHSFTSASQVSVVEVWLGVGDNKKWHVVDLVKEIGELYEEDSPLANSYKLTGCEWEDGMPCLISFLFSYICTSSRSHTYCRKWNRN